MHKLRHRGMVKSLRTSALLFLLRTASTLSFKVLLLCLLYAKDMSLLLPLGISFAVAVITGTFSYLIANYARCQLCMTQLMRSSKCSKHQKAPTILGSHRLKLSLSTLFTKSFICPFCGEEFSSKVVDFPEIAQPATSFSESVAYRPVSLRSKNGIIPQKRK